MFDIPAAISKTSDFFSNILDKFIPDAIEREKVSLELAQMSFKQAEMAYSDRDSARQREMAVKDRTPAIVAYAVLFIFGLANWYVFTHQMPVGNETLIARVLGTMDMAVGLILGYYYGSSQGSASKQNIIERLTAGDGK